MNIDATAVLGPLASAHRRDPGRRGHPQATVAISDVLQHVYARIRIE